MGRMYRMVVEDARRTATSWQFKPKYRNALINEVILWTDLYHLSLYKSFADALMMNDNNINITLLDKIEPLVARVQGCSIEEIRARKLDITKKLIEYNNKNSGFICTQF